MKEKHLFLSSYSKKKNCSYIILVRNFYISIYIFKYIVIYRAFFLKRFYGIRFVVTISFQGEWNFNVILIKPREPVVSLKLYISKSSTLRNM